MKHYNEDLVKRIDQKLNSDTCTSDKNYKRLVEARQTIVRGFVLTRRQVDALVWEKVW